MAHPQKLRVTKKQAMLKQIKEENPTLTSVYIKRELYKVTYKAYATDSFNSNAWLKERGIWQCCKCNSWDKIIEKYKLCSKCFNEKEELARMKLN